MIVALEEYKMQKAKCIEKCFIAENGCNNHKAKRCYCRMRAQKGENAIFTRSLQNRRNDSTVMREMLDDIFTVFLTKEAWRVWVGLIVLWLVVCLFAKVR